MKYKPPTKKSNRGRKPMKSTVLNSLENRMELKKKNQKQPLKSTQTAKLLNEDKEFCTICLKAIPKKLNKRNSMNCKKCKRSVHLKCVQTSSSNYTFVHCEQDYSENALL